MQAVRKQQHDAKNVTWHETHSKACIVKLKQDNKFLDELVNELEFSESELLDKLIGIGADLDTLDDKIKVA